MLNKIKALFSKEADLKEILTKSSGAMVLRMIGMATNYLFLTYAIYQYGAAGWGAFALCLSIIQLSSMIGTLGMDVGFVKIFASESLNKVKILKYAMAYTIPTNLALMGLIYWQADLIATFFKEAQGLENDIQYAALGILPYSLTLIIGGAYRGLKKITAYTFLDSLGRFVTGLLFVFIFSFFSDNDENILKGFVIGLYVLFIIALFSFMKTLKTYPPAINEKPYTSKELLNFSLSLFWNPLANRGISWVTIFILGAYVSKEDVGIYDTCFRLASILSLVLFSINSISAPKFAEFNNTGDKEHLKKIVRYSAKLTFYAAVPVFVLLMLASVFLLNFLGEEFKGHYLVFLFIVIGQLIGSISGSVGFFMQMTGLHLIYRNILIVTLILNAILGLIFIRLYGIEGGAFVIGLILALKNLIGVYYVYKKTKIKTYYLPFFN